MRTGTRSVMAVLGALASLCSADASGAEEAPLVGAVRCERIRVFGLEFGSATAKVEVDGPRWKIEEIRAQLLGGKVFGSAEIDSSGAAPVVSVFVSVKGADLEPYAKQRGLEVSGSVEAAAHIKWVGAEKALMGALSLEVTDGDLGGIPFGVKVFRFLGSPTIFGQRLTSAEVWIRFGPDGFIVDKPIRIASPNDDVVMLVEAGGTIGWDGKLDLRIQPVIRSKLLSKIPVAGTITQAVLGFLQRRSMRVCVRGTIDEPRMSWSPAN